MIYLLIAYAGLGLALAIFNVGIGRGAGEKSGLRSEILMFVVALACWPYVIVYAIGKAMGGRMKGDSQ